MSDYISPYYSLTQLKQLGWSTSLIEEILKEPDEIKTNPRYKSAAPMKLYDKRRVNQLMKEQEFVWARHTSKQREIAAALRKENNKKEKEDARQQALALFPQVTIDIEKMAFKDLQKHACENYNNLQYERGRYDNPATLSSDTEFLHRICVNVLFHGADFNLSEPLEQILQKHSFLCDEFDNYLREKVYLCIGEQYPVLKHAADKQHKRQQDQQSDGAEYYEYLRTPAFDRIQVKGDFSSEDVSEKVFKNTINQIKKKMPFDQLQAIFEKMSSAQKNMVLGFSFDISDKQWFKLFDDTPDQQANVLIVRCLRTQKFDRACSILERTKHLHSDKVLMDYFAAGANQAFLQKFFKNVDVSQPQQAALLSHCLMYEGFGLINHKNIVFSKGAKEQFKNYIVNNNMWNYALNEQYWQWSSSVSKKELLVLVENRIDFLLKYSGSKKKDYHCAVDFVKNGCLHIEKEMLDLFKKYEVNEKTSWVKNNDVVKAALEKMLMISVLPDKEQGAKKKM